MRLFERKQAELKIYRGSGAEATQVATVPLTATSTRKYMLMSEDYIKLAFTTDEAINFEVGDWCEDELFGKFMVTKKQAPTYDEFTGGYKYQLQMDAWYMAWNNKKHCLTTFLTDTGQRIRKETTWNLTNNLASHVLEVLHNLQVLGYIPLTNSATKQAYDDNDLLADYTDITTSNATYAYHIEYKADGIIDALKQVADKWETEYWITSHDGGTPTEDDFIIHFGKCEIPAERPDIVSLVDYDLHGIAKRLNAQNITLADGTDSKANKHFIFGAKDNIPNTYRKSIKLKLAERKWNPGDTFITPKFRTEPAITPSMVDEGFGDNTEFTIYADSNSGRSSIATEQTIGDMPFDPNEEYDNRLFKEELGGTYIPTGSYNFGSIAGITIECDIYVKVKKVAGMTAHPINPYAVAVNIIGEYGKCGYWNAKDFDVEIKDEDYNAEGYAVVQGHAKMQITTATWYEALGGGIYQVAIENAADVKHNAAYQDYGFQVIETRVTNVKPFGIKATRNISAARKYLSVKIGDTAMIAHVEADGMYFMTADAAIYSEQALIKFGAQIGEDAPATVDVIEDPQTYILASALYANNYDNPSSLTSIGEQRLQLPYNTDPEDTAFQSEDGKFVCINGYIIAKELLGEEGDPRIVEEAIAFDKIYPDGKLQVSGIITEDKHTYDTYEGEATKKEWDWQQYHLNLIWAHSGQPINFSRNHVLAGQTLGMRFLVKEDIENPKQPIKEDGCRLAGMQFDVDFTKSTSYKPSGNTEYETHKDDFALVRNEDFGAKLPNDILKPEIGDPCVLLNWNVHALGDLELIDTAEQELMRKGFEYAATKQGNYFTLTCKMMTDFLFEYAGDLLPLLDQERKKLYEEGYEEGKPYYEGHRLLDSTESRMFDIEGLLLLERHGGGALFVRNKHEYYAIPAPGTQFTVRHGALVGGEQTSRLLGFEIKLDKPYDTPILIIGETEAYSRLKQIEKEITKLQ